MTDVYQGSRSARAGSGSSGPQHGLEPAEAMLHRGLAETAQRRAVATTWISSLCDADLACLMAVIEAQLLPRLLREYRPADASPLKRYRA